MLQQGESVNLGWMQHRKMRVCVQPELGFIKFAMALLVVRVKSFARFLSPFALDIFFYDRR